MVYICLHPANTVMDLLLQLDQIKKKKSVGEKYDC